MAESDRIKAGSEGSIRVLRMDHLDEEPVFEFDCRIPGRYLIRLIDRATLVQFLESGKDGRFQEASGRILWIEPASG